MVRLLVISCIAGLAAIGGMLARRIYVETRPPSGHAVFHVGSHRLTLPRAMVRNLDLRDGGAVNRLDLVLNWPDLSGAAGNLGGKTAPALVFLSLEDSSALAKSRDDIDPAERPVELYARFLEADAVTGPAGLVQRRFSRGSPYEGEDLFMATPDERQFSARCPRGAAIPQPAEQCLWQTRQAGLELHVRFAPALIQDWQRLTSAIRALASVLRTQPPARP